MPPNIDWWVVVSLVVFAFALGVRVTWMWLREAGGLRERLRDNEARDDRQQAQINRVALQVRNLLTNKRVKRITIKRRMKAKS
jgi:hypothetical protein